MPRAIWNGIVIAESAAWYYPDTIVDTAKRVENYVAFWKGVTVEV
ncbi:MAG: hypothetical protein ACYDCQ_14745 [Dehalococcoidia bacterium]